MTRPSEISFVVITNGSNPSKLTSLVWSIVYNGRNHLKDYEILICGDLAESGHTDFDRNLMFGDWEDKINLIPLKDAADNARLGEMRNAGCQEAKFDTICILDDDFVLTKDWAKNITSNDFDIMTTQVRVPDGGRFWDHACYQSESKGHVILNPEETYEEFNDKNIKKDFINKAIDSLNDREKTIIRLRKFREKSITLDELGHKLKISKERVRQIETKAFEKLQKSMINASKSKNLLAAN